MRKKKQIDKTAYNPSETERKVLAETYKDIGVMVEKRNDTYREFNASGSGDDRTLQQFLDDGDKRLNSYVLSRAAQDKKNWQSNVALPTIRNTVERLLAGFSLQVPDLEARCFGENNQLDIDRAETAKWLVKGSYLQEENPVLENFWESWEAGTKGTVIKYEGYLKTKKKQKFIKSYDLATGKVEYDEKEVNVDDKCISFLLPLTEFYPWDFYLNDIQDQPKCAWIQYKEKDVFLDEYSKYPNADKVEVSNKRTSADTSSFHFQKEWKGRAGENKVEVVRYYNKLTDTYRIIANGVLLLDTCLLWTSNGVKVYPFAKSICKPFTSKHFFYGNSMPNIMMGEYDIRNSVWNSVIDKEFRSLELPLLVGVANRDALELEDELVTNDRYIYVNDINQVKPLPLGGVDNADIAMLQLLAQGLQEDAPSLPDLMSKRQATAREVVLAEEKIREMKTIYSEMMTDLWRQKYYLRLASIQLNYPQPRKVIKDKKEKIIYRTFIVPNAILERDTGERGILAIQFRNITDKQRTKLEREVSAEEQMMKQRGINYKKLIVGEDYFDNYTFHFEVIAESLHKISLAKMQATVMEKLEVIAKLFPQIFVANQEEYFSQVASAYDDNPDKYLDKINRLKEAVTQQQQARQGMPQPARQPTEQPTTTGGLPALPSL